MDQTPGRVARHHGRPSVPRAPRGRTGRSRTPSADLGPEPARPHGSDPRDHRAFAASQCSLSTCFRAVSAIWRAPDLVHILSRKICVDAPAVFGWRKASVGGDAGHIEAGLSEGGGWDVSLHIVPDRLWVRLHLRTAPLANRNQPRLPKAVGSLLHRFGSCTVRRSELNSIKIALLLDRRARRQFAEHLLSVWRGFSHRRLCADSRRRAQGH